MKSRLTSQNVVIILLYLVLTSVLVSCSQATAITIHSLDSSESGPSIDWYQDSNVTLFIDGAYTGQSKEIYDRRIWVNDSRGIDSVIFRFKWSYDDEWRNRTTVLVEGDKFRGRYEGNLTWSAPGGGEFQFKVFANNTLGYWNETSTLTVFFGYMYWNPIYTPQFWIFFVILPVTLVLCLIGVWKLKSREMLH